MTKKKSRTYYDYQFFHNPLGIGPKDITRLGLHEISADGEISGEWTNWADLEHFSDETLFFVDGGEHTIKNAIMFRMSLWALFKQRDKIQSFEEKKRMKHHGTR